MRALSAEWYESIKRNEAIVVDLRVATHQLSYFVFPKAFKENLRFGDYLLFFNPDLDFLESFVETTESPSS